MICTSSQYFSRKEKVRLCKNNLKNQVVKLAVFVLICVLVGSLLGKGNQQTSYTFYYAQNKIVNKHTRGVFPPLNGQATQIFGCWAFAAKIGSDKMDVVGFKNYTLCFEKGSILVLIKKGTECIAAKGRFYFSWKVFSFNLFVSKSKIIQLHGDDQQNSTLLQDNSTQNKPINKHLSSQDTMSKPSTTPPSPSSGAIQQSPKTSVTVPEASVEQANSTATTEQQIKCFKDKQAILDYVRALTVWTIRDGRLFLISEAKIESRLDISILVLDKIY